MSEHLLTTDEALRSYCSLVIRGVGDHLGRIHGRGCMTCAGSALALAGKLKLSMADLEAKLVAADAVPLALTWSHAVRAYDIAPHHRDPFDRLLLAHAVTEPLHLLTTDEALKSYSSLVVACRRPTLAAVRVGLASYRTAAI
jgi:PIN domain-containing protein